MSVPSSSHPHDSGHGRTVAIPHLIRLPEVKRRTGLGRSAIYARVKSGEFPQSVPLTAHARAWVAEEVDLWCSARIATRDSEAAS